MQIHTSSLVPVEVLSNRSRGSSLRRSSYALSQGPGPRRLISSGRGLRSTVPSVDEKVTIGYTADESHS